MVGSPAPAPYSTHDCKCFAYVIHHHADTFQHALGPTDVSSCSRGPSLQVGLVVCIGFQPSPALAAGPGAVAAWQLLPTLGVALGAQQTPAPGEQPVTKRTIFTELQSASMGYVCRVTETSREQGAVHPTDPARKNTGYQHGFHSFVGTTKAGDSWLSRSSLPRQ